MFARRQSTEDSNLSGGSSSISDDSNVFDKCSQLNKRPLHACSSASSDSIHTTDDCYKDSFKEPSSGSQTCSAINRTKSSVVYKKRARKSQSSQLSLKSFFHKTVGGCSDSSNVYSDKELTEEDISISEPNKTFTEGGEHDDVKELQAKQSALVQEDMSQPAEKKNNNAALVEWQRIQQLMQTSIPLCKGHKEPCVSRVVKKAGPTLGQRFYACARAEVSKLWALFLSIWLLSLLKMIDKNFILVMPSVKSSYCITVVLFCFMIGASCKKMR